MAVALTLVKLSRLAMVRVPAPGCSPCASCDAFKVHVACGMCQF